MLTVPQFVALAVGAFYVFAGVVVMRAMALDRVMNQLLAVLNDPAAPEELLRSRVLAVGAFLTLGGGVALMLLSPLAAPVFVTGALWQGGYLLWAERSLPPEDDDDARGRRQTKNAFVVYLAATAFVGWLALQRQLRPWDVPVQTLAIDVAVIVAVAVVSWAVIHWPQRKKHVQNPLEPEAADEFVIQKVWMVFRTDDAGNVFLAGDELDEAEAEALVASFTERGHKQTYTAHSYVDYEERAALIAEFNVQV